MLWFWNTPCGQAQFPQHYFSNAISTPTLSKDGIEIKSHLNAQIANMLCEDELKWYKHSNSQFILKGDSNTRYFRGVANGRHRKKIIHSLQQDEGTIEGHEQLISLIIIKICSEPQRKETSQWMSPE